VATGNYAEFAAISAQVVVVVVASILVLVVPLREIFGLSAVPRRQNVLIRFLTMIVAEGRKLRLAVVEEHHVAEIVHNRVGVEV
jgi:hypothetical protein